MPRVFAGNTVPKALIFATPRIVKSRRGMTSLRASARQRISLAAKFCCSRAPQHPPFTIRIVEVPRLPAVKCGLPSMNPTSALIPIRTASPRRHSNGSPAFPSPISTPPFAPAGWTGIEIVSRSESGRAQRLRLRGGASSDTLISASSFRYAVNRALGWNKIRSDLYNLRNDGDHILFSGRGSCHGVGLCQAGAEEMARQGKDYRQILDFYFPGTHLSKTSAPAWQRRTSERFELVSTAPEEDSALLPVAEKILKENENAIGWRLSFRARLQVFPTLDRYRDTTGQPGWVAATTRGQTVRLQPLADLRKRSILESTLRHEFFHLLIEPRARPSTPLWFREGLVLYLSEPSKSNSPAATLSDKEMEEILRNPGTRERQEKAYAAARARVASLIQRNGKSAVLDWLSSGIPSHILGKSSTPSDQGANHHP